jgi:hypothetical protein
VTVGLKAVSEFFSRKASDTGVSKSAHVSEKALPQKASEEPKPAVPVVSKEDEYRLSKSQEDPTETAFIASKDDAYMSRKSQENPVETASIVSKNDHFIPKSQRGDSDGDDFSIMSGKSSSTTDSDSISLASTNTEYSLSKRTTDLSSFSSVSSMSRKSTNAFGEQPKALQRVKTALSFSRKSSIESEVKDTSKLEKEVLKNNAEYEKRYEKTIDAIDKRNNKFNTTIEKAVDKWGSSEQFQREALKFASTDTMKPLVLKKGQEKVQAELLEKGITSVTIREDMVDAALKGLIAGKAEQAGKTPKDYLGSTSWSAKGDAVKKSFSVGVDGVKVVPAQSKLATKATKLETAGNRLDHEPERRIHPDDLNRDTYKAKGRLMASRRSERFPKTDSKAAIEDAQLSPKEKAEKELLRKQDSITELESRIENYDAKPLKAALAERDALEVRAVFDGLGGAVKDPEAAGTVVHGLLDEHLPYDLKIPVDKMHTVPDSQNKVIFNIANEVTKGGNAEKIPKAQIQVEKLYSEIAPEAKELKTLKSEQNLMKAQNAHIDKEGDTFYEPFEHSFELRVGVANSEKNILPRDLEKSRIDMMPKGLSELTTRAYPELSRRFKEELRTAVENFRPSNRMPGEFPEE